MDLGDIDDLLHDIPHVLALGEPPPLCHRLAEADTELLEKAWPAARPWIDSRFFEEAAVVAGMAVEEVAGSMPPSDHHVRYGGLAGADLPDVDRMVEGLLQRAVKVHFVTLAWHRSITEPGFGDPDRASARALVPGRCHFMCDPPRPAAGADALAARAASTMGMPVAAGELLSLTPWPTYLKVASADLAERAGSDAHTETVQRVTDRACETVAGLAAPMPRLERHEGPGASLVAECADAGPALIVAAAFLRLGLPEVARIPRVA